MNCFRLVVQGFAPKCVVYNEIQRTSQGSYMSELTPIEAEWLPELAPRFYEDKRKRIDEQNAQELAE